MCAARAAGIPPLPPVSGDPLAEKIKRSLIKKGLPNPTPKIIHRVRKKHLQNQLRKSKKLAAATPQPPPPDPLEVEFDTISREYKSFMGVRLPWEGLGRDKLRELKGGERDLGGLRELGRVFVERGLAGSLLDDDIELEEGVLEEGGKEGGGRRRRGGEAGAIQFLVDRLSASEFTWKDWKFGRMLKQSELQFTEAQLLKILDRLAKKEKWRQAMDVVQWVYSIQEQNICKSRSVYTKVLAVLGKAGKAHEALKIFKSMQVDYHIYPDMAAYHSIAVTLGQAGLVRELVKVIDSMKQKPTRRVRNVRRRDWDPTLQPDVVVFNSVLNACVSSRHWTGVSWVFEQLKKFGLRATNVTYGLAMEVMLQSGKYDLVHELLGEMKRSGEPPKAQTYRVLVRTYWEEDKVDEAIDAVREMERRELTGCGSVYYELACCLCNKGRWQEAMMEIEKLRNLPDSKPSNATFTGMILSSMDGGHFDDCISIFRHMNDYFAPNVGTINAMLGVYGRNDMFSEAKELFEKIKQANPEHKSLTKDGDAISTLTPDAHTYAEMLKASARALQWEYFEHVYKEMSLSGHPFNQRKHAYLLVQASRAGKVWHLVEHTFDSILEAGDVPCSPIFVEMVFLYLLRENYEKAVIIVNAMAHASFQVSEKDWSAILNANKGRISDEKLELLLDELRTHGLADEASVRGLLRSLQVVTQGLSSNREGDIGFKNGWTTDDVSSVGQLISEYDKEDDREDDPDDDNNGDVDGDDDDYLDDDDNEDKMTLQVVTQGLSSNREGDIGFKNGCTTDDVSSVGQLISEYDKEEDREDDPDDDNNGDVDGDDDDYLDDDDNDDDVDAYVNEHDDLLDISCGSDTQRTKKYSYLNPDLPSAGQILKAWKESREKDGIASLFCRQ
ncbi:Pentatricopeptide repeat-containing protein [Drosera capensis]